ncbi:E3 ubiquitin-protein ligase MARCHF3-like [Pholidichthys leucotaenia]
MHQTATMMTSRCTLLPETSSNQPAPVSRQPELGSEAARRSFDDLRLPGRTGNECGASSSDQPQCYAQPSTKLEGHGGMDGFNKQSCVPENLMCRICHDGGSQEELLSPCECSGTLATVHRSCLEHWLTASGTSICELCNYQFTVQKKARPLFEWLQNPGLQREKRTLFGDLVCFLLITPLATISGWLCLRGAIDHLHFSSRLAAVGLIALTVSLFTIYLFWTLVSLRYHCRQYYEWCQSNQRVVLLFPRSHSGLIALHSLEVSQQGKHLSKESIV